MNSFQRILVGLMSAGLLAVSVDAALASAASMHGSVCTSAGDRSIEAD